MVEPYPRIRTSQEQNGNKTRSKRPIVKPGRSGSGPRYLARRVIGPVAVNADHTPFHAPGRADHGGVLDDRIVHLAPASVGDQRPSGAEPARNGAVRPRPGYHLTHAVELDDAQIGIPEAP